MVSSCTVSFFIEPSGLVYQELDEQVVKELGLLRRWWFTFQTTSKFHEWNARTNESIKGFIYEETPGALRHT